VILCCLVGIYQPTNLLPLSSDEGEERKKNSSIWKDRHWLELKENQWELSQRKMPSRLQGVISQNTENNTSEATEVFHPYSFTKPYEKLRFNDV
jgi:hypothetical protein